MKNYGIISAYGLQKNLIASNRIYGLYSQLKIRNNVKLFLPKLELENDNINLFATNDVYFFNTHKCWFFNYIRKKHKRNFREKSDFFSSDDIPKKGNLVQLLSILMHNNFISYNRILNFDDQNIVKLDFNFNFPYLRDLDILITSAGPAIMNYFGYKIKKKNPNIFWVADYRDLNQNNPGRVDQFNFRLKKMDKLAFKYADLITTVSYGTKEQNIENAKKMGFDIRDRSYVLYNGFSLENNSLELSSKEELKSLFIDKDKIYIVYTGSIAPLQKIEYFLKVLTDSQQLKFIYAGNSHQLIDVFVRKFNLEDKVINLGFVKKDEAEYLQKKADILLLLKLIDGNKDKGIMTGKFYEYLTKNKKIMVIGDQDEEFNEICKNLKNVDILPYDKDKIKEYLNNLKKEDLKENYDPNIERFSWETLAGEFDDFISQKLKERKPTT